MRIEIYFARLRDSIEACHVVQLSTVTYATRSTFTGFVLSSHCWLVMFSLDGTMESAYVVENPERYLNKKDFEHIGLLSEVLV